MNKLVIAGLLVAGLGAAALPADAQVAVRVGIGVPMPPAPIYEVVPVPRRGWAWMPGAWTWNGYRHVWVRGHWVKRRPVYAYAPARIPRYY